MLDILTNALAAMNVQGLRGGPGEAVFDSPRNNRVVVPVGQQSATPAEREIGQVSVASTVEDLRRGSTGTPGPLAFIWKKWGRK